MKLRNEKDGPRANLEKIELILSAYKVLLHFQDHEDPLVIHFDTPSRRFYFAHIALVVTEMNNLGRPEFIHIRKHENTLRLLDSALAGPHASKTVYDMWEKIRKAWRYRLPDLEKAALFKILERDLLAPHEAGGNIDTNVQMTSATPGRAFSNLTKRTNGDLNLQWIRFL